MYWIRRLTPISSLAIGGEVEELDERDAADAEDGEERELAPGRAQARAPRQQHDEAEPDERAEAARLREAQRRDTGLEHDLRHRAVDGEQHRRAHDHEVAGRRPARGADALGWEIRRVDHDGDPSLRRACSYTDGLGT